MKNISLKSTAFLLFLSSILFSQNREDNSVFQNYSSSAFDQKDIALNLVGNSSSINESNRNSYLSYRNSLINIQQIGNYNNAIVNINSQISSVSVSQEGNNNEYSLVKDVKKIIMSVQQSGNDNIINDYSYRSNYDINAKMIQNGNDLNIKSIGANSISKDMTVSQKGNGASVIIINKLN